MEPTANPMRAITQRLLWWSVMLVAAITITMTGCDDSLPTDAEPYDQASEELTATQGDFAAGKHDDDDDDDGREKTKLVAKLTGDAEVGEGDPDGAGKMRLTLKPRKERICFRLRVRRIDAPTRAHIHRGVAGVNGPVEVFFFDEVIDPPIPIPRGLRGCVDVPNALIEELSQSPEQFYINIHNDAFPAGAIRGQLEKRGGDDDDDDE